MLDDVPSGDLAVYVFLEMIALGFVLEAVNAFRQGEHWWKWIGLTAIGSVFFVTGIKWPTLKKRVSVYLNSRLIWMAVFGILYLYCLYSLQRVVPDFAMHLHQRLDGPTGYAVVAITSAALACGVWWVTGRMLRWKAASTGTMSTSAVAARSTQIEPLEISEEISNPLGHLAQLGWGIKEDKNAAVFEVENKELPNTEESAKYFRVLKKPFRLQFQQVPSLAGLHHLAGIKNCFRIDIGASNIDSLSELSGMTNLRELAVGQTPFTDLGDLDIGAVSSLTNLENLVFTNSRVRTIDPVRKLKKLTRLSIHASLVDDLSPVASLRLLKYAEVRESRITDLTPLSGIAGLEELMIDAKQARSLSAVPQIKRLTIMDQVLVDLTDLSSLLNLTYLSIWGPPSLDFSPFRNLDKLTELHAMGPMFKLALVNNIDAIRGLKLNALTLSHMQINSLSFLNGNSTITDLTLSSMPVNNGAELGTMSSLRKLTLFDVPIVDISPLLSSPKLREVSLLRVPARADVISLLQKNGVKVTNN